MSFYPGKNPRERRVNEQKKSSLKKEPDGNNNAAGYRTWGADDSQSSVSKQHVRGLQVHNQLPGNSCHRSHNCLSVDMEFLKQEEKENYESGNGVVVCKRAFGFHLVSQSVD